MFVKVVLAVWFRGLCHSVITCALTLFVSPGVYAHPHSWIDLQTTFFLNEFGKLTRIAQKWQFDAYYSVMTLSDLKKEYGDERAGLQMMAARMVKNLASYHYFSDLRIDGVKVPVNVPSEHTLKKVESDGQNYLQLEMVFDFETGVTLNHSTLAWQVFDPTYYIAMEYAGDDQVKLVVQSDLDCQKKRTIPEPSNELLNYALSLDRNEKGSDGLGRQFAETVEIRCLPL